MLSWEQTTLLAHQIKYNLIVASRDESLMILIEQYQMAQTQLADPDTPLKEKEELKISVLHLGLTLTEVLVKKEIASKIEPCSPDIALTLARQVKPDAHPNGIFQCLISQLLQRILHCIEWSSTKMLDPEDIKPEDEFQLVGELDYYIKAFQIFKTLDIVTSLSQEQQECLLYHIDYLLARLDKYPIKPFVLN